MKPKRSQNEAKMKPTYGLTGGIASGKSTVGAILTRLGAIVIDADEIARSVVAKGTPGLDDVVAEFGAGVCAPDGGLDRAKLGAIIFHDESARLRLNSIIHPRIEAASMRAILQAQSLPGAPIFYEAALLVETGRYRDFPRLVAVACHPDTQLARLMSRDGLDEANARARIESQRPLDELLEIADHVIWTDGTYEHTEASVRAVLAALQDA